MPISRAADSSRVGAVHEVLADLERVVAAHAAGRGLDRVGDAHEAARAGDGVRALDDQRDERPTGDELDELAEERALAVLAVVLLGGLAVERAQLHRDQRQALLLQPGDDLAGEAPADAVGLDEDEGALHEGLLADVGAVPSGYRRRRSRSGRQADGTERVFDGACPSAHGA